MDRLTDAEIDLGQGITTADFLATYGPLQGEDIVVDNLVDIKHQKALDEALGDD